MYIMASRATLVPDNLYPDSAFTRFENAPVDFLIMQMVDGKPAAIFQQRGSMEVVSMGYSSVDSNPYYLIKEPGGYRMLLAYKNSSYILNVYYTHEYRGWIEKVGYCMHEVSNLTLSVNTGMPNQTFPRIFACRGTKTVLLNLPYTTFKAFNSANLSATSRFWLAPGDPATFVASFGLLYVKLLTDTPWYTPEFRASLSNLLSVSQPTTAIVQTPLRYIPSTIKEPTVTSTATPNLVNIQSAPPLATVVQPILYNNTGSSTANVYNPPNDINSIQFDNSILSLNQSSIPLAYTPDSTGINPYYKSSLFWLFIFIIVIVIGLWIAMNYEPEIL